MLKKTIFWVVVFLLPITSMAQPDRDLPSRGERAMEFISKSANVVVTALSYLGTPYKWGGNSMEEGVDCSALVKNVYESAAGVVLPRTSYEQSMATDKISKSDIKPGDLLFFNTRRRAYSHVAIYIGDGQFIHSPRRGQVVRIESFNSYWIKRFNGARRVEIDG